MKHTEQITTTSFETAYENISLVYGAVKAAGVYPHHRNYDDYLQEGVITFAKMLDDQSFADLTQRDLFKFIFKKIMWQTTDGLRRERFAQEHFDPIIEENEQTIYQKLIFEDYDLKLILDELKTHLSQIEIIILEENLINGYKITELTEKYNLKYRTVSRIKQALIMKLKASL